MADDHKGFSPRSQNKTKYLPALIGIIVVTVVIVIIAMILTTVVVPSVKDTDTNTDSELQNGTETLSAITNAEYEDGSEPSTAVTTSELNPSTSRKSSEELHIVSRHEWKAKDAIADFGNLALPIKLVIIHHTVTEPCNTSSVCAQMIQQIQTYQMSKTVDFGDIGYGFVVAGDGNVYEGKGWYKVGAHSYGYNRKSIGIAFLGNFMNTAPPQRQLDAALNLLEYGLAEGILDRNYQIVGNRQVQKTDSPGTVLQRIIETWQHWVHNATVT